MNYSACGLFPVSFVTTVESQVAPPVPSHSQEPIFVVASDTSSTHTSSAPAAAVVATVTPTVEASTVGLMARDLTLCSANNESGDSVRRHDDRLTVCCFG
jgi:hypothetical protein